MKENCRARRYNDEMHCGRCGLVWDVNDPEPPKCRTDAELKLEKSREKVAKLREGLRRER